MKIGPDSLWKAVIRCDERYDGFFYYAVKTTGIFCRPSCRSKTPKRENVEFFFSREESLRKGYKPCKRCRPDLQTSTYAPNREWIQEVKKLLETEFDRPWTLQSLSKRIGISPHHLQRLFKKRNRRQPQALPRTNSRATGETLAFKRKPKRHGHLLHGRFQQSLSVL